MGKIEEIKAKARELQHGIPVEYGDGLKFLVTAPPWGAALALADLKDAPAEAAVRTLALCTRDPETRDLVFEGCTPEDIADLPSDLVLELLDVARQFASGKSKKVIQGNSQSPATDN